MSRIRCSACGKSHNRFDRLEACQKRKAGPKRTHRALNPVARSMVDGGGLVLDETTAAIVRYLVGDLALDVALASDSGNRTFVRMLQKALGPVSRRDIAVAAAALKTAHEYLRR